jgi:hypothetical protein
MPRPRMFFERFWSKVDFSGDGCWPWLGYVNTTGYGTVHHGDRVMILAHRASWILANGAIGEGLHVLHRCDTPACVNPNHLFIGTHADNMADMAHKGRGFGLPGRLNPNARYTEEQISELVRLVRDGWPTERAAKHIGVSFTQAHRLVKQARQEVA